MYFLRNFKKRIENNKFILRQMDDNITQFRSLTSRERNVLELFDYRTNNYIKNSKILVTCEHASNELNNDKLEHIDTKSMKEINPSSTLIGAMI